MCKYLNQSTVKTLKHILWAFLASAVCAGCSSDLTYTPGAEDNPDNYGVYFPEQDVSTTVERDPADEPTVSFKVRRTRYLEAITVPVVITPSEEGILEIEPITFGPGEAETEFEVSFPNAVEGTEYKCDIRIEDPDYISLYGPRSTELSFSVVRAGWELVKGPEGETKGKWRDDFVSNMYSNASPGFNKNPEVEVEIYQRRDMPGYYRMKVFNQALITAMVGGNLPVTSRDLWTIVDARKPERVYIPYQSTGLTFLTENGELKIASNCSENFMMEESASEYGTLENGIITFPAQSIMAELENEAGKFFRCNRDGMLRIQLPGVVIPDYTVTLSKNDPADGVVEIAATLVADAAALKFSVFEGTLDAGQASLAAQDMDAAKEFDGQITASGTIRIENKATGKYTLVGCVYDEAGFMQDYVYVNFGYVARDDEQPVIVTMGLEATNEYAGQGISTDNAVKFYAYGENIESVTYGLFRTDRMNGADPEALLNERGIAFTAEQLEALNGGHFSTMLTKLASDREFTLLMRAYNGYVHKIFTATCRTTGTYNALMDTFEFSDFLPFNEQPSVGTLTGTEWNYYALNFVDEKATRRKIGKVTMKEGDSSTAYTPKLSIFGLSGLQFDSDGGINSDYMPGVSDFSNKDVYGGALRLNIQQTDAKPVYKGQETIVGFITVEDLAQGKLNIYSGPCMYMGAVADGCLYCVPSVDGINSGYTFRFLFSGSNSEIFSLMDEMLLIDPTKDHGMAPSAALENIAALRRQMYASLAVRNLVEQREFTGVGGYLPPVEVRMPINLVTTPLPASAPAVKRAPAAISIETTSAQAAPAAATGGFVRTAGLEAAQVER